MKELTEPAILFIGDNISDCKLIKKAFKGHGNPPLLFVRTAKAGLAAVKKGPVKALFVNEALPDMDGFEFLERLKKMMVCAPLVMVMSEDDKAAALKAIRKGAKDCVIKKVGYFNTFPFVLERAIARYELDAERAELEKLIKASRQMWMAIIDGIKDFIFIVDGEAKIFGANRSLAQLFGKHPKDLIGKNIKELFGEDLSSALSESVRSGLPQTEEKTIQDGTYLISSFPLQYNNASLTICVMKNISEMRRLKEQLYHSYKLASLGLLISGIAHELNNPITGIITFAEVLRMKNKDEKIDAGLGRILDGAERCKKVIENLLTFSRQKVPSKSLESINDVIDRAIELRSYWLRKHNIKIVREYGDIPTALLDSQQLQQVILNILLNAEQAIAEANMNNGRVTLATKYDGVDQKIIIKISDNGPGIPKDIISNVFDPFFTTKPVGKGTGLGLSIVHGIIAEHGGNIRVESSEKEGSTFFIDIPLTIENKDKSAAAASLIKKGLKADNIKDR